MADEIIVRIRAEGTDKFMKQLKKSGVAVEKVGDESDKTTKKITKNRKIVEKSNQRLEKSFKKVGVALAATFGVAALSRFAAASVKAADVQLKAEAKLLTALKGRQDIQSRLMKQASELQKVTLFGDEATINAQALLASLGLNEDAIRRLIPLIQDLATKSGMDLSSTADLVAKSVGSSTNALSRYGVQIEGAVGSSERLESAISSLNEQVGGQAIAAAEAGAGGIVKLQNAVGDLQEEVGKAILEGLTPFAETLQEISENKEVIDFFKAFGTFVGNTLNLIGKSISGWNKLFKALDGGKSARKALAEQTFDQILLQRQAAKEAVDEAKANKESTITVLELQNEYNKLNNEFQRRIGAGRDRSRQQQSFIDLNKEETETTIDNTDETDDNNKKKKEQLTINESYILSLSALLSIIKDDFSGVNIDDTLSISPETLSAIKEYNNVIQRITKDEEGRVKTIEATDELQTEGIEKIKSDTIKAEQDKEDARTQAINSGINAAQNLFNVTSGFLDLQLQQLQNSLQAGQITREEFDRERAEILRKQAIADKANAVFQIGLNTASGITAALSAGVAAPALIAVFSAIAAAQLAQVLAAPIPQFAVGTKGRKKAPKGMAWVGEEGPELVQMRGGENVFTADDSEQLMKLLGSYGVAVQFKTPYDELYKPMTAMQNLSKDTPAEGINWNPLLNSNDINRRSSGRKLDKIHMELQKMNKGITRKMTKA